MPRRSSGGMRRRRPWMRKEKGQVFTPPGICRFMAGLFTRIPDRFRLLDRRGGGRLAGVGRLRAAFRPALARQVEIHLYETDRHAAAAARGEHASIAARPCSHRPGTICDIRSIDDDFILDTRGAAGSADALR